MKLKPKIVLYVISFAAVLVSAGFLVAWGTDFLLTSKNEITIELKRDLEAGAKFLEEKNPLRENLCLPAQAGAENISFQNESDKEFCFRSPKLTEARGIQIDLTAQKALLYDGGKLVKILPVAYQSKEGKWYQTPTGYFRVGVKHKSHSSSLFPVSMPYAVQFYEDFFFHEIPFYKDGTKVDSSFSGGCLRFEEEAAKEIYEFSKTGDQVVVFKTFGELELKPEFSPPVDFENYWIRQRFNNSLRMVRETLGGSAQDRKSDYYQHAGVDFAPNPGAKDENVYAVYGGKVVKIVLNGEGDHGFGNTVILEHKISSSGGEEKIYSLYGHLGQIAGNLAQGREIQRGEILGRVGNSGFGCQNYWKVDEDGCDKYGVNDVHLHFEIKHAPVLENPKPAAGGGGTCLYGDDRFGLCYGYVPDDPVKYGYFDPMKILFNQRPVTSD